MAVEGETTQLLLTNEEESAYDEGGEASQQNQTAHRLNIRKLLRKTLLSLRTFLKNLLTLLKYCVRVIRVHVQYLKCTLLFHFHCTLEYSLSKIV